MSQELRRLVTCASLVCAAMALTPTRPAAQQPQAFASQEAMQRAQEAYQAEKQRDAIALDKSGVVKLLMDRWRDNVEETQKGHEGFEAAFMGANPENLFQLTQAKTWDAVVAITLGLNPAVLGSSSADLVFNPVTPCRVMDSRWGTGAYAGPYTNGQTISLFVTDPLTQNGHNQGGAGSCGIPFGAGTAVALNITVVPVTGNGDLKVYPFGAPAPTASIINFYEGLNLANATSAAIALANATNDLTILVEYAASVHIIVDVMGYYAASHATALQTVRVNSAATTIANGGFYNPLDSPVCPAGYTLTGGGYNESAQISGLWVWQNGPGDGGASASPTFWRMRGYNNTGGSTTVTVYGVCGRVPGH